MLRDWIPAGASRLLDRVVTLTGRSRIVGVDDWESAVARTPGYGALDSSGPPTRPEMPLWMSARTQQVMAAFGSALDRCQGRLCRPYRSELPEAAFQMDRPRDARNG